MSRESWFVNGMTGEVGHGDIEAQKKSETQRPILLRLENCDDLYFE